MRTTRTYRLIAGLVVAVMIAGFSVMPGTVQAENGTVEPPKQIVQSPALPADTAASLGDSQAGGSEGTTASSIAAEALLLILTTL